MRTLLASLLSLTLLSAGCRKKDAPVTPAAEPLSGTYTGTFQRQVGGSGPVSNVSLTFSSGTWTGTSQTPRYPALCNGTYAVAGPALITFQNNCAWTADFDWSFILGDTWQLTTTGNQVSLVRDRGTYRDVYELRK